MRKKKWRSAIIKKQHRDRSYRVTKLNLYVTYVTLLVLDHYFKLSLPLHNLATLFLNDLHLSANFVFCVFVNCFILRYLKLAVITFLSLILFIPSFSILFDCFATQVVYRDGSVESYVPYERLAVPRGALLAATAGVCVCVCE